MELEKNQRTIGVRPVLHLVPENQALRARFYGSVDGTGTIGSVELWAISPQAAVATAEALLRSLKDAMDKRIEVPTGISID